MITLNERELSLVQGGDGLDDHLLNPYMYPVGGGNGGYPGITQPPSGYPGIPGIPSPGGFPGFENQY